MASTSRDDFYTSGYNTSTIEASSSFVTANSLNSTRFRIPNESPGPGFPFRRPRSQSSRSSRSLTSFRSEMSDWQQKNPSKPPMIVRIGGVVNPGQYWVRELTMSRTEKQESRGVNAEIFRFEKGLASRYNTGVNICPKNPANVSNFQNPSPNEPQN